MAGPLDIRSSFDLAIREAANDERFIKRIGKTALEHRPPTGFVRDAVMHHDSGAAQMLDIKQGGSRW